MNIRLTCRISALSTLFLVVGLASKMLAQFPVSAAIGIPIFIVAKQPNYIQTDSATLAPRGGNVRLIITSLAYTYDDFQLKFEVAGAAYPFSRSSQMHKMFATTADMERAFPSNSYGRVVATRSWERSEWQVIIPRAELLPAGPVISNFAALQTWEGGGLQITWNLPPQPENTPIGLFIPHFNFYLYRAQNIDFTSDAQLLGAWTAPAGGITLNGLQTSPGETLYGELRGGSRDSIGWIRFPIKRAPAVERPVVTSNPQSQAVREGEKVTLSVQATGPALTYQWRKDDSPIAAAVNPVLEFPAIPASAAGRYTVVVTNANGQVVSEPAILTVLIPPKIESSPSPGTISAGDAIAFAVSVKGTSPLSYQWLRSGTPIPGATVAELYFPNTRLADSGSYSVVVTNLAGAATSNEALLTVLPITRISNISIRSQVGGSVGLLTVGVSIGGGSTAALKPLLVRAVGPTLAAFGVDPALSNPRLTLLSGQTLVAQNDDWGGDITVIGAGSAVGAFNFNDQTSKDAALVHSATVGGYTMQITGTTESGIALAEVYDATPASDFTNTTPRLTNVSALTRVGVGGDVLIAGFAISGAAPKSVLIRGIGPALAAFGVPNVLNDPKLELYQSGVSAAHAANDDWSSSPNTSRIAAAATSVAAFALPVDSRDAAILVTLEPGSYTVQVSGANNSAGMALVEVYEIP